MCDKKNRQFVGDLEGKIFAEEGTSFLDIYNSSVFGIYKAKLYLCPIISEHTVKYKPE